MADISTLGLQSGNQEKSDHTVQRFHKGMEQKIFNEGKNILKQN